MCMYGTAALKDIQLITIHTYIIIFLFYRFTFLNVSLNIVTIFWVLIIKSNKGILEPGSECDKIPIEIACDWTIVNTKTC